MDLTQLMARLRAMAGAFTAGQLVTLGVTFVLVVGIVAGSALWLNTPTMSLLFADMDPETAGQMVERLKALKVPYQLDPGGRAIRVPADRIDELRLELTTEGMPASGRIGFEIFDRTTFGATEFLEHVNYRRALEGEIARTIATLAEVASARVHISMAKDSLFGERRPAKASVVLRLRTQQPVAHSTVSGIANLVAGSVEGLRPEAVVILDTFGRPLARPQEEHDDPMGAAQLERQQRLERDMASRVVALLEPVVGFDRVRVNVATRLNTHTTEEREEQWDPNSVVRTQQTTSDVVGPNAAPMLVAGARANMPEPGGAPGAPAAQGVATTPGSSRQSESTTYEVSRRTRHVVYPRGEVERLSVAVILDDHRTAAEGEEGAASRRVPRTAEELQKIQSLVAAAVGLDPSRGDQLTVENVSFDEPIVEETPAPTMLQRYAPGLGEVGRVVAVVVIVLAAFFLVVRPVMRQAGLIGGARVARAAEAPEALPPGQAPRTVAELELEIESQLDAAASARNAAFRKMPVLTRKVSAMSKNEPEQVASLLRSWMADEGR